MVECGRMSDRALRNNILKVRLSAIPGFRAFFNEVKNGQESIKSN